MIAIQNMYTDWLLFEWLNLIMPQMVQLACVCPWSLALLRSGYHYPHFQRAWFWSDPIGPVIVCDLRPSVITYDMVCPHLTPYKAIHSIDSQLLHHHTIKELQKFSFVPVRKVSDCFEFLLSHTRVFSVFNLNSHIVTEKEKANYKLR